MSDLLFRDEAYRIVGAAMEVYNDKGNGFLEPVYQECMEIELASRDIPFVPQKRLPIVYKGQELRQCYIPDLVCYQAIIVELKAVREIMDEHRAQLLNYLKATGLRLGLLVNFGRHPKLEWERLVL